MEDQCVQQFLGIHEYFAGMLLIHRGPTSKWWLYLVTTMNNSVWFTHFYPLIMMWFLWKFKFIEKSNPMLSIWPFWYDCVSCIGRSKKAVGHTLRKHQQFNLFYLGDNLSLVNKSSPFNAMQDLLITDRERDLAVREEKLRKAGEAQDLQINCVDFVSSDFYE